MKMDKIDIPMIVMLLLSLAMIVFLLTAVRNRDVDTIGKIKAAIERIFKKAEGD